MTLNQDMIDEKKVGIIDLGDMFIGPNWYVNCEVQATRERSVKRPCLECFNHLHFFEFRCFDNL